MGTSDSGEVRFAYPYTILPYTANRTSVGFLQGSRDVGIGGAALPLAQAGEVGIDDKLFSRQVKQFRTEPRIPLGLAFTEAPFDLGLLPSVLAAWRRGELPGTPAPSPALLKRLADCEQLAAVVPWYALPAGDAVSVSDVVVLLNRLAAGDLAPLGRVAASPAPRRAAEAAPRRLASGRVTPEDLMLFVGHHYVYEMHRLLREAIPWERVGWRASAPAITANAIVGNILGIPIELRLGALVPTYGVGGAVGLAAGRANPAGDDEARLNAFVRRSVPRIRATDKRLRDLRGSAWSVPLDEALNSPAVWFRDANGVLPRARPARAPAATKPPAARRVISEDDARAFRLADPRDMARA